MQQSTTRSLRVRNIKLPFAESEIPRWWFHANPFVTHASNGLGMLFPEGERFFIRSVKHYLSDLDDPELVAKVRAFFGQEGRHGHAHEQANDVLRTQGYDLDAFYARFQLAFEELEPRVPPVIRLSTTVACEHFTAIFAHHALTQEFIEGAHPVMRGLMRWHACEEIEHKSVAFDVLKAIDPRYWVRVAGLVLAVTQLVGWWMLATRMLLEQEDLSPEERRRYRAEAAVLRGGGGAVDWSLIGAAFVDYLRPDFHPDQRDDYHLARAYLDRLGEA